MDEHEIAQPQIARIAVYDDLLSQPRIVDIQPTDITTYIEQIAVKTYELAHAQGSQIPYQVIREVSENFIHAQFKEPTVSIMDKGNTIRFTDQGPGIANKDRAQLPGFTSATSEMREYIRGVGSGLPTVKEYLRFTNGRLVIEDNIREGTVITISMDGSAPTPQPVVYQESSTPAPAKEVSMDDLTDRELEILSLASEMGAIGPTDIKEHLDVAVATAHRSLKKLVDMGLMEHTQDRKRILTDLGYKTLEG